MTTETIVQETASEAPLKPEAIQSAEPGNAHGKRSQDKAVGKDAPEKLTPEGIQTGEPGNAHANRHADKFVGEGVEAFKTAIGGITPFKADIAESMTELLKAQGITEEFATQAVEVFEAAVNTIATEYTNNLAEAAQSVFVTTITSQLTEMQEVVDATVAEAVTEWITENKIALDESVRQENNNALVAEMTSLIAKFGFDITESQGEPTLEDYSLDELKSFVESEEFGKLDEAAQTALKAFVENSIAEAAANPPVAEPVVAEGVVTAEVESLTEENIGLRKQLAVSGFTRGMSDLQAERISTLAEGLTFSDDDSFTAKLKVLSENFVGVKPSKLTDEGLDPITEEVIEESTPAMDPYIASMLPAMSKYGK